MPESSTWQDICRWEFSEEYEHEEVIEEEEEEVEEDEVVEGEDDDVDDDDESDGGVGAQQVRSPYVIYAHAHSQSISLCYVGLRPARASGDPPGEPGDSADFCRGGGGGRPLAGQRRRPDRQKEQDRHA